jgi:hypothetical protein
MFKEQQRLSLAIAALLLYVISHGIAAKMPNQRRRAEADLVAFVLKAPANIHIVARGAEDRIKPGDGF